LSGRRPVVGLTPDFLPARGFTKYTVYDRYVAAVRAAGALPVMLAPNAADLDSQLALVQGVVLTGGDDLDPALWGEAPLPTNVPSDPRRTTYELALVRRCLADDVPLLGVCLGLQLLVVACGGTLVQEIAPGPVRHRDDALDLGLRHEVTVTPGSLLARALERPEGGRLDVSSYHRQAPGRLGAGLRASAVADDGVVEAAEHEEARFCLGVQWHPDLDADRDPASAALFRSFVAACADLGT